MLRHNLLLIYRNFKRFRSTFFINLIGLSTGLACVLLIYLWANDELSVDKFNKKDEQLFRAMEHRTTADGIWTSTSTAWPLGNALAEDRPEVEYTSTTTYPQQFVLSMDDHYFNAHGIYAGKNLFKMFSYDLIHGDKNQVLADKNSVVISETLAMRLFNTTDNIIGRTIRFQQKVDFQVTGVFKAMPVNATEQFDFVLPIEKFVESREWTQHWKNTAFITYVLLKSGINIDAFNTKLADYIKIKTNNEITYRTLFLKKYSDNYLYGKYENGALTGGRITYVRLFSLIAVFILIIACINFMNLSTAKASRKVKDVGIKKAIGAGRRVLIFHYLGESLLMSFLSLLVAILLVDILISPFNIMTGKHLVLHLDGSMIGLLISITLITGVIAGSYPALYLSGFNPAAVLKGKLNSSLNEVWARKGLVVFQFVLSIVFIVSVIIVYKQIEFIQSTNIGYSKNNIIYFRLNGSLTDTKNQESLIEEVKNIPGIEGASSTGHNLIGHQSGTSVDWPGKNPEDKTTFENVTINYGAIEMLGIEITEGRSFSSAISSDTESIIFNQKAIEFMGITDPVGKVVKIWDKEMKIIGVVKNFHFESLHEDIKPLFLRVDVNDTYLLVARFTAGKEKEVISSLEQLYKKFNPGFTFDYKFLDEVYQSQYVSEQRVAVLSKYFAGLAILISCLGLFGLASFTAERRNKEIGIRKILGSSEFGIVYLLSGDFTKIVFTSIVIAVPLSYQLSVYWLQDFATHIELKWWYFIGSGVMALVIAWLTVGTQALKAAKVNPTQCLKEQ